MADLAPRLSEDLERFADDIERGGLEQFEWTPEGGTRLASALARAFRMLALEAKLLEARLDASDAVIAAVKSTRHVDARIDALKEGLVSGKVTILHPARRESATVSDGDAA